MKMVVMEKKHAVQIQSVMNEMKVQKDREIEQQVTGLMSDNERSKIYEKVRIEEEFRQKMRLVQPRLLRFIDHTFPSLDLEKANENI